MKVLFLDIDGVLNGYNKITGIIYFIANKLGLLKLITKYHDIFGIHDRKVKLLSKIVKATNCKVVLSSSWRFGYNVPYEQKDINQKKLVDKLNKYGIEIIDVTPKIGYNDCPNHRETEIRDWLSRHDNVESFVILDDEQFDLQGFIGKELVRTSNSDYVKGDWYENTGLKKKHVKLAIKILNQST